MQRNRYKLQCFDGSPEAATSAVALPVAVPATGATGAAVATPKRKHPSDGLATGGNTGDADGPAAKRSRAAVPPTAAAAMGATPRTGGAAAALPSPAAPAGEGAAAGSGAGAAAGSKIEIDGLFKLQKEHEVRAVLQQQGAMAGGRSGTLVQRLSCASACCSLTRPDLPAPVLPSSAPVLLQKLIRELEAERQKRGARERELREAQREGREAEAQARSESADKVGCTGWRGCWERRRGREQGVGEAGSAGGECRRRGPAECEAVRRHRRSESSSVPMHGRCRPSPAHTNQPNC